MKSVELEDGQSDDIVSDNISKLKELFPEAFSEGGVNFDTLRQLLGDASVLDEGEEKYGLNWHGKKKARQIALTPSTGTLLPCPEESVDWGNTQNLFIEGDNLEVLKLLQKSYANKVKMIYIDPPYNTGKEFVYPDNYQDNLDTYLKYTGQKGEEGLKLTSNTETGGRKHTNWLNMMYPRLKNAKNLLKKDGAIFVSCDENEHVRLRAIMDEVFGNENFIADLVWAAGKKNDSRLVSVSHEYIIVYAKNSEYLKEAKIVWRTRKKGLDDIYAAFSKISAEFETDYGAASKAMKEWFKSLPDSHPAKSHKHYASVDERGLYFPDNISWPGGGGPKYEVLHPTTNKPVKVPSRGWMTSDPNKMRSWIEDNRVHFGIDENTVPCIKSYLIDRENDTPYSVFYRDGRAASKRLRELMGDDVFDFPKDETVLQELIEMLTADGDIIIDFFAGSGTTAHSIFLQSAKDSQNRRFILVQLPETVDPDVKSQSKAAIFCEENNIPLNIASMAQERLRRSAAKVKEEFPQYEGDTGFRVFKLAESNIQAWSPDRTDLEESLLSHEEHLVEGRSEQDVLYELLLKRGVDLAVPIESREVSGKNIYSIGYGVLFACLDESIAKEQVEDIAQAIIAWYGELAPSSDTHVFFRDSAFRDDVSKTNMAAILEQNGITHVRSL
ncbi:MAG: site-specific DNA-methyltransferase [Gammaproteobacteria bacterium]|nr:site-specific DNA-methyltransferase [Gammaproteobacteria bacterium]